MLWPLSRPISSRSSKSERVIVSGVFIDSWDSYFAGLRKWVFVTLVKGSLGHTSGDGSRCETSDSVPLISRHLTFTIHILFFVKIYGLLQQRVHVLCKYPTSLCWCKWSINSVSSFIYHLVNLVSCKILLLVFIFWSCWNRLFLLLLLLLLLVAAAILHLFSFWVHLLFFLLFFFLNNFKFLSQF